MRKKDYDIARKSHADMRALLRGLVSAYLLFLAFQLLRNSDPDFPAVGRFVGGGVFAVGALLFGWFTWKQYRAALKEAELTTEEEGQKEQ